MTLCSENACVVASHIGLAEQFPDGMDVASGPTPKTEIDPSLSSVGSWRSAQNSVHVKLSFSAMSKRHLALILSAAWSCVSLAAPTPAPVRAEIDVLLARLQRSGCQFSRNGTWHDGPKAKEHLLNKLKYIERKGTVQSTEQFIELAGSASSSSGKAYEVKCGGAAPVQSQKWLTDELAKLRSSSVN